MTALWAVFEGKLNTILGGRSPILAFEGVIPGDLLGKCFFFCHATQPTKYAQRTPQTRLKSGTIDYLGGASDAVLWSYDHSIFTAAAAAVANPNYDEGSEIVLVDRIASGSYGSGLGVVNGVSLFDHSLATHKHTRPSDGASFFIQERGVSTAERYYTRGALAEIIMDGVTEVAIPDTYDKYCFFRIHNLNYGVGTVTFGSGATGEIVEVPPLGVVTVRRDRTAAGGFENYRVKSPGYFFDFEEGDYRHFWIDPLNAQPIEKPSTHMRANNISCPSIVYDWIQALGRRISASGRPGGAIPNTFAWWYIDGHQTKDVHPIYSNLLGDPSNPATRIGDLIWHKGALILGKVHRTNKQAAPNEALADVELSEITYNGLSSIVADFAAHGIEVTTAANGAYQFRMSAASAVDYSEFILIPHQTNLFMTSQNQMRAAYQLTATTGPTLSAAFFDSQAEDNEGFAPVVGSQAPQLLRQRSYTEQVNSKVWYDFTNGTPPVTRTVVGDPYLAQTTHIPQGSGTTTWTDLHNRTVADLLTLAPFKDTTLAISGGATHPLTLYTGARLVLTPFGLHLLFDEKMPAAILGTPFSGGVDMQDFTNHPNEAYVLAQGRFKVESGYLTRHRVIKFRGHGFPWIEREIFPPQATTPARSTAMFQSPRHGRRIPDILWHRLDRFATPLVGGVPDLPSIGWNGADYEARDPGDFENDINVLFQFKRQNLSAPISGGRFWMPRPQDALNWIARERAIGEVNFKAQLVTHKATLYAGGVPSAQDDFVYQLLSEHFNGMAMAINQLTEGKGLDYKALRFVCNVPGQGFRSTGVRRNPAYTGLPEGAGAGSPFPIPIDAWDFSCSLVTNPDGNTMRALYEQAGIPIRTLAEVPSYAAALAQKNQDRKILFHVTATVTGSHYVLDFPENGPTGQGNWFGDASLECFAEETYVDVQLGTPQSGFGKALFYFPANPGFPPPGFADLATTYANFWWVKQSDVLNWLSVFGLSVLPAGFDEVFVPLELRMVRAGRTRSDGQFHSPVHGGFTVKRPEFNSPPLPLTRNPDGVWTSASFERRHLLTDLLAFAPARTPALASWKCQASVTRTVKNIKWWNDEQPMHFVFQGAGLFVWTGPGSGTPFLGGEASGGTGPVLDNQLVAEDGPYLHYEWNAEDPDDPENSDPEALADHDLWLQMHFFSIHKLAVRAGSGDTNATRSLGYAFRPFWAPETDHVWDTIPRILGGAQLGQLGSGTNNGWFPQDKTRHTGFDKFKWEFVTGPGSAVPAIALEPGINMLEFDGGNGRNRFHIHFGDKEPGLLAL